MRIIIEALQNEKKEYEEQISSTQKILDSVQDAQGGTTLQNSAQKLTSYIEEIK